MFFGTIFWDVILGWYYNMLGWKLSKQTSYWSITGFFFSVKNHNRFSSQNIVPKNMNKSKVLPSTLYSIFCDWSLECRQNRSVFPLFHQSESTRLFFCLTFWLLAFLLRWILRLLCHPPCTITAQSKIWILHHSNLARLEIMSNLGLDYFTWSLFSIVILNEKSCHLMTF